MSIDLKMKDIEFLQVAYEINQNPGAFEHTDKGEMPATTQAIRVASGLDSEAVRYRMGKPNDRGLEAAGLTSVHAAVPTDNGYNQTSVELTEKGVERLTNADRGVVQGGGFSGSSDEIAELEERVAALEDHDLDGEVDTEAIVSEVRSLREAISQVESTQQQLLERVNEIEENDWGGLSDETAEDVDLLLQRGPAMMYAFKKILSIDIDQIVSGGAYSPDQIRVTQEQIYTELAKASELAPAGESSDSDGEGNQRQSGQSSGQNSGQSPVSAGDEHPSGPAESASGSGASSQSSDPAQD